MPAVWRLSPGIVPTGIPLVAVDSRHEILPGCHSLAVDFRHWWFFGVSGCHEHALSFRTGDPAVWRLLAGLFVPGIEPRARLCT